jgi:chaperonin GroES
MNLKPIGDRIVVRREAQDGKSKGGIILPENAQKKPQTGTVLAVGPGKRNKGGTVTPLQLKVNDKVLFTTWAGDEFKDSRNKDEVLLLHESDVLAVLGD